VSRFLFCRRAGHYIGDGGFRRVLGDTGHYARYFASQGFVQVFHCRFDLFDTLEAHAVDYDHGSALSYIGAKGTRGDLRDRSVYPLQKQEAGDHFLTPYSMKKETHSVWPNGYRTGCDIRFFENIKIGKTPSSLSLKIKTWWWLTRMNPDL